jgi:hypothetical protein
VLLWAESDLRVPTTPSLRPFERRALLALPPGQHARTRAWANALRLRTALQSADATALANAVLEHIRREPYVYTLEPGRYRDDAVDEFWLDRRAGFCEHYAAAFVVVMRSLGVPARIVTGYQGSDLLPTDGYLTVRQSHAHAWAEYWQAGRGWQRADPTAAVAPERILRSEALEAAPGFMGAALEAVSPDLRLQLRRFVESIDNRWNQWILGYGKRQQFNLLGRLGVGSPDLLVLARVLVGLVVAVGMAGAVWAWFDARRQSPWQRLRQGIARELGRLGLEARPSDTLASLANRVRMSAGERAGDAAQALLVLEQHRYGRPGLDGTPAGWWRDFRRAVAKARGPA